MMYEVKFGLIGFVVGTLAISATTFASNIAQRAPVVAMTPAGPEQLALLPVVEPVVAEKAAPALATEPTTPMSEWRRAYIARHGHQPPVPAPKA